MDRIKTDLELMATHPNLEFRFNITEQSKTLFMAYAKDAGNWSGTPLVGGNVGGSKQDRGNLTQLKQASLIKTDVDEGCTWVIFTDLGRAFAKLNGVEI